MAVSFNPHYKDGVDGHESNLGPPDFRPGSLTIRARPTRRVKRQHYRDSNKILYII